jgi:hypothetical protein
MNFLCTIILFIVWPFGAFVNAIKNIRIQRYRIFIFLFFCLLAFYIIPYSDGDIRLYAKSIETYSKFGVNAFFQEIYLSFQGKGSSGFELFIPINSYLTSLIGNDFRISFLLTTLLFYTFWISIIKKLIKEYDFASNRSKEALLLLFMFSIYVIFYRVLNGRFYLAYWGAVLGVYMIMNERKNVYLLLTLSTIFIHQSFIFLNGILIIHLLFQKYYKNKLGEILLFSLIIAGAILNQVGLKFISENLGFLSDNVSDRYMAYTKDSFVEKHSERAEIKTWFQTLRGPLLFYSTAIFLLIIRFTKKKFFSIDTNLKSWYYFILLFWALNSLTFEIPQFGDRFRNVLIGFMILFLYKIYIKQSLKEYNFYFYIFLTSFAFYKLITIRVFAEYINLYSYFPLSFLFSWFDPDGYPLIN